MSLTRLFEIAYSEAPQVDRDAGVIRGVKILGRASRNDREYSDQALRDAARFYEGLGVNLNHRGREQPAGARSVEDGLGWLQKVEVRPDGVYGDLHYFRAHPQAGLLAEAAERNPRRFGLSHHAEGLVERKAGKWVVESIAAVKSVDVVQNPATSNGLFESTSTTLEQLAERVEQIERTAHCRQMLEAARRRCCPERLDALKSLAADDERQRLIESWPEEYDRLPARPRPEVSRPLRESHELTLRFPATTREFVAAMR